MNLDFDVVIVGAGSAGCVLANRLSRDPAVRVLLLEAGGWDWNPLISIPVGARKLLQYKVYQWRDESEPDPELGGRRHAIPHGKVIGGGSSINYMAHTRGHPEDFARWVAKGARGWSYDEVLPFYKACETWERGGDAWRGADGELGAEAARMNDPIYRAWFDAVRNLGHNVTDDYNGECVEGFGTAQYTVRGGQRSSAAKAFLKPVLSRPNLTVLPRATATRLLFDKKRVVGVEFEKGGVRRTARSSVRTVLSLGAINTPHLLMLSGVGPADHLKSMGIAPVVDLPVGKNLQDHLAFFMHWTRPTPGPFHASMRLDRAAINMLQAYFLKTGPASLLPGAVLAFIKSHQGAPQPDLEFIIPMIAPAADVWFPGVAPAYKDGYGIRVQLTGQKSRGEIKLRSANPEDRPRVFYRSLTAPEDLAVLREGFKKAWALGNAPELESFRGRVVNPASALSSDAEIDGFIRANSEQQYHPAGTCQMGDSDDAVVNPDLSVRGLEGVCVADASVMPDLVSSNPNVSIMMIAAKAAAIWQGAH